MTIQTETEDHEYRNRPGRYSSGLGTECVKCRKTMEHTFDPASCRTHPVGTSCSRCGTTEWQYVDGVLCNVGWGPNRDVDVIYEPGCVGSH